MGNKLPLARQASEGYAELLAGVSYRVSTAQSDSRDKRKEATSTSRRHQAAAAPATTTAGKSSSKAKGTNGVPARQQRCGQDDKKQRHKRNNKDRKQNRGNEGKDTVVRRTAQELGVAFPAKCTSIAHYWKAKGYVHKGVLFQCIYCLSYIWLPADIDSAVRLGRLISKFGDDEGYCMYLNHASRRPAKIMMAKLQELQRLSNSITNSIEFAKLVSKILNDKEYDYA